MGRFPGRRLNGYSDDDESAGARHFEVHVAGAGGSAEGRYREIRHVLARDHLVRAVHRENSAKSASRIRDHERQKHAHYNYWKALPAWYDASRSWPRGYIRTHNGHVPRGQQPADIEADRR